MPAGGNGRLRFGEFEFDALSETLFRGGQPVRIEPQPLRVLSVLLENTAEIVSRDQLRNSVWGDSTFVEFDQGLNYCIRRIRLALRDEASKPLYVETLPKQGYRFIARVTVAPGPVMPPDSDRIATRVGARRCPAGAPQQIPDRLWNKHIKLATKRDNYLKPEIDS